MDDGLKATRTMADAAVMVAEYKNSDAIKAMDAMLTSLADVYKCQLVDVSAEELVRLQSCLRQTIAIRSVIRGAQQLPTI